MFTDYSLSAVAAFRIYYNEIYLINHSCFDKHIIELAFAYGDSNAIAFLSIPDYDIEPYKYFFQSKDNQDASEYGSRTEAIEDKISCGQNPCDLVGKDKILAIFLDGATA